MVGVYKITNLITGDCYVGQSIHVEEIWAEHFCKGYGARHNKLFQDAIDSQGKEGFSFQIIEECDPKDLWERERYWISELKPAYNTIVDGHPVSEETRKKISKSLTGKKQPIEIVERRRKAILERYKRIPRTNAGHRKRVAAQVETVVEFESVKACAEYFGVDPSTVTKALKRGGKVKKTKVWYVV